jgi:fluoride exporter
VTVKILLVGLGGSLGAIARYALAGLISARVSTPWPYGTFVVNVSGCFVLGFFVTLGTERLPLSEELRLLVSVGFIGAYTTFSTYQLETFALVEQGGWWRGLAYALLSLIAGFAAMASSIWLARRF